MGDSLAGIESAENSQPTVPLSELIDLLLIETSNARESERSSVFNPRTTAYQDLIILLLRQHDAAGVIRDRLIDASLQTCEDSDELAFGGFFVVFAHGFDFASRLATELGAQVDTFERMIALTTQAGLHQDAQKLADRLGRPLSRDEVLTFAEQYFSSRHGSSSAREEYSELARRNGHADLVPVIKRM